MERGLVSGAGVPRKAEHLLYTWVVQDHMAECVVRMCLSMCGSGSVPKEENCSQPFSQQQRLFTGSLGLTFCLLTLEASLPHRGVGAPQLSAHAENWPRNAGPFKIC